MKVGVHKYTGLGAAGGRLSAFRPVASVILTDTDAGAASGSCHQIGGITSTGSGQTGSVDIAHIVSRACIKVGGTGEFRCFRGYNFVDVAITGSAINGDEQGGIWRCTVVVIREGNDGCIAGCHGRGSSRVVSIKRSVAEGCTPGGITDFKPDEGIRLISDDGNKLPVSRILRRVGQGIHVIAANITVGPAGDDRFLI